MAFIADEVKTRRRKRSPNGGEGKKLLVGEKVEVIDCQRCSHIVALNNMIQNGVYSGIIESIPISEAIERNSSMVEKSYSSRIRHKLKEYEITSRLCVDVFIEDSWRGGVLVGRKRDYSSMLVFFPGTSDEILAPDSKIRLPQEWNEVSGDWSHQDLRFFLEIFKKNLHKNFVLSGIKERFHITDTLRQKIKVWYSGSDLMRKELVLDVIRGAKSAASRLPATHSSSSVEKRNEWWAHERVGRSFNEGSSSLASNSHTCKYYSTTSNKFQKVKIIYSRKRKRLAPHNLDSGEESISDVESYAEMEVGGHQEEDEFRNNDGDSKIVLSSVFDPKFTVPEKEEDKKNLASRAWKPLELEGTYCHDLLDLSSSSSHAEFKTHSKEKVKLGSARIQKVKLRKHLVSTGWRIESKRDPMVKFRYISPEQRIFYSLIKVFQYLLKEKSKMRGKTSDKGKSKDTNIVSLNHDQLMHPIDAELSATQKTSELLFDESDSSGLMNCQVVQSNSPEFIGENAQAPGNCSTTSNEPLNSKEDYKYEDTKELHVIEAYVDHIKMLKGKPNLSFASAKELRSKTRDYLLEKGWKFWLYDKKVKLELRYTSPNRRTYISLYAACKGYLEEAHCEKNGKMSFESINGDKSFNGVTKNSLFVTPNKKEVHELLPGLITPDSQKILVMQREGLEQGPFSSSNFSNSKEHLDRKMGPKRRKLEYQKSLSMQKEGLEQGSFSCSNLFDSADFDSKEHLGKRREHHKSHVMLREGLDQGSSPSSNLPYFSEFDSKEEHSGKKRELKRRKIEYPNSHESKNNYSDRKHSVKMHGFSVSRTHKPSTRSFASRVLRSGKRSRLAMVLSSKDKVSKTVLSWLIDRDVVLPRQKVAFVRRTDGHILKEGWITYDGVRCRCCLNVFPLSKFGSHAGSRTSRPSASIILQDGRSLLDCQMQILSALKPNRFQHERLRGDYSNHEADDICSVCRDGGLIMLCDLCPSAFHPACVGLEDVPEGQWFCPSCRCGTCGLSEFNCDTENFTQNSGIYCDQCERQYHVGCLQKQGQQLKNCPTGTWTCSKACSKIISHLRLLLGESNPTHVNGLNWTILRSNVEDFGKLDDESMAENSGMLHIALDVLHECFEPMVEARTQSDLLTDIILNNTSELNRLNFRGFYAMLLMCGDELIGVATFRIFGHRLAEMPFIGIRVKFRRQGMCRIMMNELQKLLSSLGVERLLLPAIPELLKTWTSSFGFTQITASDTLQLLLEHTFLTFHGTTTCQKFLKKSPVSTI